MTYIVLEMYFALHSQNILSFHYLFIDYSFMKDATQKFMEQMDIIKQFVARYCTSFILKALLLHLLAYNLNFRRFICPLESLSLNSLLAYRSSRSNFFCWLGLIFYEYNKILKYVE